MAGWNCNLLMSKIINIKKKTKIRIQSFCNCQNDSFWCSQLLSQSWFHVKVWKNNFFFQIKFVFNISHNLEISHFFCHSEFPWNHFWGFQKFQKLQFCYIWGYEVGSWWITCNFWGLNCRGTTIRNQKFRFWSPCTSTTNLILIWRKILPIIEL